jgi:translation elongation factor EF-G
MIEYVSSGYPVQNCQIVCLIILAVVTNSSIIHSDKNKKTASTQYNKLSQQLTIVGSTNVNTKLDFDENKMVNAICRVFCRTAHLAIL